MKKPYPHDVLGTKTCRKCGKPLKKRIQEQKPSAAFCYHCWSEKEVLRRGRRRK